ncbi:hypothetical protein OL548_33860 (plasmid) [Lysinibacillus sp. MHQ-1]|nr:hypothetical protein OL548_33860 [Lysinibacillus sp. MHQ-1]
MNAKEGNGSENEASHLSLTDGIYTNIPFLENLLENWSYIKNSLGEDISTGFTTYDSDPLEFWEKICLVVSDDYPEVKRDIIKFLETRTERTIKPNLLKILSKEHPKSSLLLEYIFEILERERGLSHEDELVYTAARILGKQFNNDPSVLKKVRDNALEPRLNEAAIVALCEGWPDDDSIIKNS